MVKTLDMQNIRYINLFEKVTKIPTRFCFKYNDTIMFAVPARLVNRAVGENGRNMKRLNEILGKKIKVVPRPSGIEDAENFIRKIISPFNFKEIQINENEIVVTAGRQSKAALIGRNKRRLLEMQKIISDYFSRQFRIT